MFVFIRLPSATNSSLNFGKKISQVTRFHGDFLQQTRNEIIILSRNAVVNESWDEYAQQLLRPPNAFADYKVKILFIFPPRKLSWYKQTIFGVVFRCMLQAYFH